MADSLKIIENCTLGKNVTIRDFVNMFGCEIGDNTKVGCFVEIQKTVKIGKNCKIEPFAFIPAGVTIGDGVFVGPHVCFTNDKKPRAVNADGSIKSAANWKVTETVVEDGAAIGANATIVCGVKIGRNAVVGAGAVVTKDVPAGKIALGTPARIVRDADF
jgi:UDP-2-acetamido-3-amino-2,3-dideoxy-glucuronate N-acetyltransferase